MARLNVLVDWGLLLSGLVVICTGIAKLRLFSIRSGVLSNIHDFSGVAFAVLAIIHIVLHWRWFLAWFKR